MPRSTYRPNLTCPRLSRPNVIPNSRSRSCPPQDRCARRLAQSWPNHACQIRARVAWLMPSDRSEVRPHLPRRDLLTSPRAIDVQGAPQAPSPSSAKPMLAQRQGSAPARTPRSDPTICSRLSSHACLSTPPAPGPRRRITSETVPSRTRRNWGPAPGPRDARWEEVAYPYPNFLPGVFWSRRTPNAEGAVAPQVSARLPHTAGAPIPKELGVGTRPKRCTLERSCLTTSSLFCQVFSAMRAELTRGQTTATRPPPRAQSRSGEGGACLRPPQSPAAGPKDARWKEGGQTYPTFSRR